MFDITWSDPGSEKVGERKARKEREQEARDAQSSSQGSRRTSSLTTSTSRSSSSADQSVFSGSSRNGANSAKSGSLFGFAMKRKRISAKGKSKLASELQIPSHTTAAISPSLPTSSTARSTFSSRDFALHDRSLTASGSRKGKYLVERVESTDHNVENASKSGSMLSNSTQITPPLPQTPPARCPANVPTEAEITAQLLKREAVLSAASTLGITATTEVVYETASATNASRLSVETRISADKVYVEEPSTPTSPLGQGSHRNAVTCAMNELGREIEPIRHRSKKPKAPPLRQAPPILPPTKIRFTAHDPDRWKAPEEWDKVQKDDSPASDGVLRVVERRDSDTYQLYDGGIPVSNLGSVKREIQGLSLLVPRSILSRLEERFTDQWSGILEPDAHREAQMAKTRLLLYAMRAWNGPEHKADKAALPISAIQGGKIAAIFETQATASYIVGMYHESQVTHIASSTQALLSADQFPNLRPVSLPASAKSVLSLPSDSFDAAYCLGLPAVLPSQEIPEFIHNVYKILKMDGILHMVLFDPTPVAASMGPRLRQWLDDNLLFNLETKFRCTKPTKLVPHWCTDAYLQADKNTIKKVKCPVMLPKHDHKLGEKDNGSREKADGDTVSAGSGQDNVKAMNEALSMTGEDSKEEKRIKLELQVQIAKMIWKETWGSFVNAKGWWWEDPECAEECLRLGTYWEYSFVAAKKNF